MKLLVLVKGPASIARYLATVGEATEVPEQPPEIEGAGVNLGRYFTLSLP
jgi:hypothetical protein